MSIQYDTNSSFDVPFWAHELALHMQQTFAVVEHYGEAEPTFEAATELNAPCSSVSLSTASRQKPILQTFTYKDRRTCDNSWLFSIHVKSLGDTLAWRIDVAEAYEKDGMSGVLQLLRKQTHSEEKLRGQTQIANDFLWRPMPAAALDVQRLPLGVQRQLRFVARRRLLTHEEAVLRSAVTFYAVMCRPSFSDLNRRLLALGEDAFSANEYAQFSAAWERLEKSGQAPGLRPWVKPVRAYIKHLTE